MHFSDTPESKPTGRLRLEIYRKGELIEVFDEQNLIVDGSKEVQAKLIGGTVTNNSVTQFGVGTNGTAPAGGNTALTAPYLKNVDAVTYPAVGQVRFTFSLSSLEANGMAIMEFGLLTAAGVLYARRVRAAALNKDADISISGTWTITF